MKVTKRIFSILIVGLMLFMISGCSLLKGRNAASTTEKDDSAKPATENAGYIEYTIAEYNNLIDAAQEAGDEVRQNAMDAGLLSYEYEKEVNSAYSDVLRDAGLEGNDTISLTGYLYKIKNFPTTMDIIFHDKYILMYGDINSDPIEYGWLALLKEGAELQFQIPVEEDSDGCLSFGMADVLSQSIPEFQSNCGDVLNEEYAIIFGKVVDIFTFKLTAEEIEEAKNNATGVELEWYKAMGLSNEFIVVEDDAGKQVGVFIDTQNRIEVEIGQKIGCGGTAYRIIDEAVPDYFLSTASGGGYYIYE